MQNLIGWCDDIRPFPIGSYYCDGRFVRYEDIADVPAPCRTTWTPCCGTSAKS